MRSTTRAVLAATAALAVVLTACSTTSDGAESAATTTGGPAAASVASITPPIFAQTSGTATDGGITVSGLGRISGVPDTLTLTMGVSLVRENVSDAVGEAAALADALITRLSEFGIEDADMQTSNYSIYPEYDYRSDTQRLLGYRVSNTLTVKITDIDRAGEIIDAASSTAGNEVTVQGVSFSIEDNAALVEQARTAAWNDALAKAQQLATLSGIGLGAPTAISETFSQAPPILYDTRYAAAEFDVSTPIQAGTELVTVNISVTFAIGD